MMTMFFAQRVILEKTKFSEVPSSLKEGVKEILEESGVGFLAIINIPKRLGICLPQIITCGGLLF